jgi:hypothetical protein
MVPSLPFVELLMTRGHADCGIVALAMFLNQSYENVLAAMVTKKHKAPHHGGMYTREIVAAAKRFDVVLALRRSWDEEEDTGLLTVERLIPDPNEFRQHIVLLKFGLIFDNDGKVWEPETYYQQHEFKPVSLLVAVETK